MATPNACPDRSGSEPGVFSPETTPLPCLFMRPTSGWFWRRLALFAALAVLSAAALPLDKFLAQWGVHDHCPPSLGKLLQLTEVFGHGFGVLLIGLTVFTLDPVRRWAVPRLLFVAVGSGMMADVIKVVVARARPRNAGLGASALDVLHGWMAHPGGGAKLQSFPSGHAAASMGLALALGALYPRGRWLFFSLAFLSACQRVEEGAHFPSDVLFGAAVGTLVATACLYGGPIARWFDRREIALRGVNRR